MAATAVAVSSRRLYCTKDVRLFVRIASKVFGQVTLENRLLAHYAATTERKDLPTCLTNGG